MTLTAGSNAFYFSTFSQTANKKDVDFRLGVNDDAYDSLKKLSAILRSPLVPSAPPDSAIDNSATLGESLHALVAVKTLAGDAQVWELTTDAQQKLGTPLKLGDSFDQTSSFSYPVERALSGIVHSAWINADGTISVLSPGGGAAAP